MKFTVATLFLATIFGMVIAAPVKREEAAVASTEGAFEEEKTIVIVRVKGEEVEEAASKKRDEAAIASTEGAFEEEKSIVIVRVKGEEIEESAS
ncbi:hypothetical protein BELL_0154g00070 [Botrytis elliptica]|uniref:Inhibitor I9 domain-containing protein n=1 Tax=Botrytis elliptica TaxID=278938 RepID=A0A4Z1JS55_9HELO|nr:hypothetical protein EAE99_002265 [Botrytis elliptica]TGO76465.1 hypothetical protein BELL_0154g00070 [Botrytis elliptica]